jgi:hypothetical protein
MLLKMRFFYYFTEDFLHPKNNKTKTTVEKYFINKRFK